MTTAYRSDEDLLRERLAAALHSRDAELEGAISRLRRVYSRRIARLVSGAVGTAGGAALFLLAIASVCGAGSGERNFWSALFDGGSREHPGALVWLLLASSASAALAYLPARIGASLAFERAVRDPFSPSGSARRDLERLARHRPKAIAEERIARAEPLSVALPLVAMALLGPLSMHLGVWIWLSRGEGLGSFGGWITTSVLAVGVAHLVLARAGVVFARSLRQMSAGAICTAANRTWLRAYGYTVLASLLPGALLLLIPPVVTALTGLLLVPLMFLGASYRIAAERKAVGAALAQS